MEAFPGMYLWGEIIVMAACLCCVEAKVRLFLKKTKDIQNIKAQNVFIFTSVQLLVNPNI